MMAKAAACAAKNTNFCFIKISVGKLFNKYAGVSAEVANILLDIAQKNKPTVLFIDEVEALTFDRNNEKGNSAASGTAGTLLDRISSSEGIFMITATNVPW